MAPEREHLTVPQMARELGVSQEKVRTWCRNGMIRGVTNIGDHDRRFYRATRQAWDEFKASRSIPDPPIRRMRYRAGTNLLGI